MGNPIFRRWLATPANPSGSARDVESKAKEFKKMYFFYTTCPKCAKFYGKNYIVILAEV